MITDELQILASLCKGCGVCAGICPHYAITMERDTKGLYVPSIDMDKCSRCLLCVISCPAMPAGNLKDMAIRQFSDTDIAGQCLEVYAGYSTDESLRYRASSGGVVTALLLHTLDNGVIDAALLTGPSENDPFASCCMVAKDRKSIIESTGSRYLPVEFSTALRQVIDDSSVNNIGIVGLPCHIDGIKRACSEVLNLRKKIVFTIALFCKQMKDLRFTDIILAKMEVKKDEVQEIKFRGEGWPGAIQVKLKNGNIIRYPYEKFSSLWGIFSCTPMYCLLCTTPMGEVADISIGDAWLDKYRNNRLGVSAVLVRSDIGREIVNRAVQSRQIYVEPLELSVVVDAQPRFVVTVKKSNFVHRLRILSLFNSKIANLCDDIQLPAKSLSCSLEFLWILGVRGITSSFLFRRFCHFFPGIMLKTLSRGVFAILRLLSRPGVR